MRTPFDVMVDDIVKRGYHNHRLQEHSDVVCTGIFQDLLKMCDSLRTDFDTQRIGSWPNVKAPGARHRKIDMLIGEPRKDGKPDIEKTRICIENKSVVTAHRNRDARFDDLNEALQVLHRVKSEAVLVATVVVGTAEKVLNVPDKLKSFFAKQGSEFETRVLPRLSKGDASLWTEFGWAVSKNRPDEPAKTIEKFRQLPVRQPAHTHQAAYDYLLFVPVHIDNVNPPYVDRSNGLGIDVDSEYAAMLERICRAYTARWHM